MVVLKADPKERRKALYIVLIGVLISLILIQWVMPEFEAYLKQRQPKEARQILITALSMTFLSLLPITIYLFLLGNRILKAAQFPPPGMKVFRDTEIMTGDTARRRGHQIKRLSFFLAFTILYSAFYFDYSFFTDISNIKNSFMSSSKEKYFISVVILTVFLFGVSLLICKWIDSYLSKNKTKEKEIKQGIIIQDKKTLFINIGNSMLATGITMMLAKPYYWIFDFVFRHLFPFPIKGTVTLWFAIIYITITVIILFVLLIYTWRWLKRYLNVSELPK